jgi:hypothetical protein
MPWMPELFSASVLERIRRQAADARASEPVSYFAGVMSGEVEALVESFAGEPELHHPVRGRVKGSRAFEQFVAYTSSWSTASNVVSSPVQRLITPQRGIEETVLTFDGEHGRTELPMAIVADRADDGRIIELRLYYSMWPLNGRHANRPPVLQPDPDLREPDVVGEYQRALAAGDVEATVAAFEPDGRVQEREASVHRGRDELTSFYKRFFSNGGGVSLEHCAVTDDGRSCALEYNVVRWGRTELLPPEAGVAVYVRGATGRLASARIYDDADPRSIAQQAAKSPATDGGNDELEQ